MVEIGAGGQLHDLAQIHDADDKALLQRFQLFGPPAILFYDRNGRELPDARVIGYQDAAEFGASLNRAGL